MEKYKVRVNEKEYVIEFDDTNDINSINAVYINGVKTSIDINMDTLSTIIINNNSHKINGIYEYDGEPVKLLIGKDYHKVEVEEFLPVKRNLQKVLKNKLVLLLPQCLEK